MPNIKFVNGDILTKNPNSEKNPVIVCHQVNCKGTMGAGLAKQVRSQFPGVYKNYREKCQQIAVGIGGLGDVQFCCEIAEAGYLVANIFGEDKYGREKGKCYTNYKALETAFKKIATGFPTYTIRIPYLMGCGLGGGDWNVVTRLITECFSDEAKIEIWMLDN